MPSVLGMKPDAPKSMQRRITAGIVVGRHHDDRDARILRAQIHQPGEAAHARHGQIEQDEIDFAAALEQLGDIVERSGLGNVDFVEQAGHRLAQRPAKQRMIVRDDQTVANRVAHPVDLPATVSVETEIIAYPMGRYRRTARSGDELSFGPESTNQIDCLKCRCR